MADKKNPSTNHKAKMTGDVDYGVLVETREGPCFRIPRKIYSEAVELVGSSEGLRAFAAGFFPVLVIGFTVFFQFKYGGGMHPSVEGAQRYALSRGGLAQGWTPLLTHMFLHAGAGHLILNMLAVGFFGWSLAYRIGFFRSLVIYIASGIAGGIFGFLVVSSFPDKPLLGASGAIYGILIASILVQPFSSPEKLIPWPLIWSILFVLGLPAFHSPEFTQAGVSHTAHLAGAIVGVLLLLAVVDHRYRDSFRGSAVVFLVLLLFSSLFADQLLELWRNSRGGHLAGDWPVGAKQAVKWAVGSGFGVFLCAMFIVRKAREVDALQVQDEHDQELKELIEESGEKESRPLTDILEDLHKRYRIVYRAVKLPPAFGKAAVAHAIEPLMVACPLCEHELAVTDIGDQSCSKCAWKFTIDLKGKVTAGVPESTTCPACRKQFAFREGGHVACPECTWKFRVDSTGAVVSGKPIDVVCTGCGHRFRVATGGEHPCPRCRHVALVPGQAGESETVEPLPADDKAQVDEKEESPTASAEEPAEKTKTQTNTGGKPAGGPLDNGIVESDSKQDGVGEEERGSTVNPQPPDA